jgi:hypothetical protein
MPCLTQVQERVMAGEMLLTPEEIEELKKTFIGKQTRNFQRILIAIDNTHCNAKRIDNQLFFIQS